MARKRPRNLTSQYPTRLAKSTLQAETTTDKVQDTVVLETKFLVGHAPPVGLSENHGAIDDCETGCPASTDSVDPFCIDLLSPGRGAQRAPLLSAEVDYEPQANLPGVSSPDFSFPGFGSSRLSFQELSSSGLSSRDPRGVRPRRRIAGFLLAGSLAVVIILFVALSASTDSGTRIESNASQTSVPIDRQLAAPAEISPNDPKVGVLAGTSDADVLTLPNSLVAPVTTGTANNASVGPSQPDSQTAAAETSSAGSQSATSEINTNSSQSDVSSTTGQSTTGQTASAPTTTVSTTAVSSTAVSTTKEPTTSSTEGKPSTSIVTTTAPSSTLPSSTKPTTTRPPTSTTAPPPAGKIVWQDNFDQLNTQQWSLEHSTYGDGNNELQCYRPENVSVRDGKLVLRAVSETYTCPKGDTRQVTSGMVRSKGATFSPGQSIEFRVKLTPADPNKQGGLWPAVWSSGWGGGGWPAGGELDYIEVMTAENPKRVMSSMHYSGPDGKHKHQNKGATLSENFSAAWHIIRFDYGHNGELVWWLDGKESFRVNSADTIQGYPAPFDQSINEIKINLALGGSPGPLDPGALGTGQPGATFEVDYIRIIQN